MDSINTNTRIWKHVSETINITGMMYKDEITFKVVAAYVKSGTFYSYKNLTGQPHLRLNDIECTSHILHWLSAEPDFHSLSFYFSPCELLFWFESIYD